MIRPPISPYFLKRVIALPISSSLFIVFAIAVAAASAIVAVLDITVTRSLFPRLREWSKLPDEEHIPQWVCPASTSRVRLFLYLYLFCPPWEITIFFQDYHRRKRLKRSLPNK